MIGRVPFTVQGVDYALHYTVNRLCDLEKLSGLTIADWGRKLASEDGPSLTDLRKLFAAGLFPKASLDDAGDILGQMMAEIGVDGAIAFVTHAYAAAFPPPKGGASDQNP